MADLQTLQNAFMKADAAGDTASAQVLATEIKRQRAATPAPEATPTPQTTPAPIADYSPFTVASMVKGLTPLGQAENLGNMVMHPLQTLQQTDDVVRRAANTLTGGYADKFAGFMNGAGTDAERARSEGADTRLGAAGPVVDIGSMALAGPALAARGVTAAALPKVAPWVGSALDSAAYGALDAGGHDNNVALGAAEGLGLGALGHGIGSGLALGSKALLGGDAMNAAMDAAPTYAANKAAKTAAYKQLEDAGIKFDADGYQQTLQNISGDLRNFRAAKAPQTADTLNSLADLNGTSPNFVDLEDKIAEAKGTLRDHTASDADKKASSIVLDHLNDFFNNGALMTNGSIPADQVGALAANARELARRDILSKQLNKMSDKADWYVSGNESGLRNQVALFGKRAGTTLSPAEQDAAQAIVRKEGLSNVLNQAGTRLAMHGATGAGGVVGLLLGGPLGALAGMGTTAAANLAARKVSGNLTQNAFDRMGKVVLMGRAAQNAARSKDAQALLAAQQRNALLGKLTGMGATSLLAGQ